ncbi:protein-L-isoaspartate O-methyltransferase family protein [Rhodobaculum claviforme]|uniref:Protein-L-isoaspartate O-methyltransferase n=1 Tax=Rhodobaculum claviforme TaxID=1549854 RepID=A0A934TI35_9RHOB|nr:protein-L-isoaspartate O-methyltransferase [Rhodobaculum claviforme]MBK5926093.1 protein-L-isoaspartate O-methyltransferase [Rhodobaculum claviforme]
MTDYTARRLMMVDTQIRPSDVTKFPVIDAMLSVPREVFVPTALREAAYVGENLPLAPGRVLLDPRTLGKICDVLDLHAEESVLDVGCGYGYSTAVLARMAGAVVAVEDLPGMAAEAEGLLAEQGADNATVIEGPLDAGAPRHGPYDVIVVQGGIEVLPARLWEQLRPGGRIAAVFMQGPLGIVRVGHRTPAGMNWRDIFNATAPVIPAFARAREFQL